MVPYPIAPPSEEEALLALEEALAETSPRERAEVAASGRPPQDQTPSPGKNETPRTGRALFSEALLEMSSTRPGRRTFDYFLSIFLHGLFLATLLLVPLYFTEALDLKQFTRTFLVAPPPPPPPPPPAAPLVAKIPSAPRRVFTLGGKLLAPTVIPQQIAMIKEEVLPPDVGAGVVGGVPGGVPGGQLGGVIGGIISGASRTYIPVAPTASGPRAPLRVGGRVKAPRVISAADPVYPVLARQARVQGDVVIDAVIDTSGNVVEMQVVSGHALLFPAAMEALRHWKYEPTYLNEQPVPVQLVVIIKFQLN